MSQPLVRRNDLQVLRRFCGLAALAAAFFGMKALAQPPFTPEQHKEARELDDDLAKECKVSKDQCRRANARLLLQAQVRLAEWGYGTRFTAEPDPDTIAAIRLYQQRNNLPISGKLDGLTVVRMDADEKAVEAYPYTLPPFYFPDEWNSSLFMATGVFRNTATRTTSGPIEIWCQKENSLCLTEESTTDPVPAVAKMYLREWTSDHIIAEEVAGCYTNQLRVERASKSVVYTSFNTSNEGPCGMIEKKIVGKALPRVYSEELVDGSSAEDERSIARGAAIRRVKRFSRAARSLLSEDNEKKN